MDQNNYENFNGEAITETAQVHENPVVLQEKKTSHAWLIILLLVLGLGALLYFLFGMKKGGETPVNPNEFMPIEERRTDENLAQLSGVDIEILESFPVQVNVRAQGDLADGCTYLEEPQVDRLGNVFVVKITTFKEDGVCTQALVPFERNISLPVNGLPGGAYIVNVNGQEYSFELEQDNIVDFSQEVEK